MGGRQGAGGPKDMQPERRTLSLQCLFREKGRGGFGKYWVYPTNRQNRELRFFLFISIHLYIYIWGWLYIYMAIYIFLEVPGFLCLHNP